MKFAKLTMEQVKSLEIGSCVNFGNGQVFTITEITERPYGHKTYDTKTNQFITPDGSEKLFSMECGDKSVKYAEHVLTGATIETMDVSVRTCAYCGAIRPGNEFKEATIFINRGRQTDIYCVDAGCAGNAQMAAEG
jgi:hypothetical protein